MLESGPDKNKPRGAGNSAAPRRGEKPDLRIGFVPLIDAAPLIVALELGYFAAEGLRVRLERQIGWGNVRDKLTFGQLDASHAPVGMPAASQLGLEGFLEPLVALASLGSGGNAITFGNRLVEAGVDSAAKLAQWLDLKRRQRPSASRAAAEPPKFAHVFGCSMHHYLLREWLAAGGVDVDLDVRLSVVPPPQMAKQMTAGCLDAYCVGEPWNMLAERLGCGRIVAVTTDILPDHPEKVLAVSRRWLERNTLAVGGLLRAVLRGCAYCDEPANQSALAEILSLPRYLDTPRDVIEASLRLGPMGLGRRQQVVSPERHAVRSFAPEATFPSCTHAAWVIGQMVRWGHVPHDTDVLEVAARCVAASHYREAAAAMGIDCPADDFPPMRLRHGTFDPTSDRKVELCGRSRQ